MSLADTLKGLVGKGKEAAAKNADKINEAVDKAGTFIDEKTGHKYTDKIEKGKEAAKKAVPTDQSAPKPEPAPEPEPAPAPEPPEEPEKPQA
ncbi:antitoxin [Nocardia sp. NPDC052112]|uniref:antitoxin n=1 Tax=Nocardia sp. NPDC052112 TaxID=3155646 RepID=UPI00343E1193